MRFFVAAFEASRYKVKDCTKEPLVGINVTSDEKGNFYLDQKKLIESAVKAAKVSGAKVQKLPYPRRLITRRPKQRLTTWLRYHTEH